MRLEMSERRRLEMFTGAAVALLLLGTMLDSRLLAASAGILFAGGLLVLPAQRKRGMAAGLIALLVAAGIAFTLR